LAVTPPTWRSTKDLLTPEDLIEEIGRVLGYGDIPYTAPTGKLFPHIDAEKKFERRWKEIMSKQLGYHEVENYSLTTEEKEQVITDKTGGIEVTNPLSRDLTHFKASLIPNLLENATVNARLRNQFKLFETARLYEWKGENLIESRHVAAVLARDKRLDKKQSSYNHLIFHAKEDMEELLVSLGIEQRTYTSEQRKAHHPLFAPQTILVTVDGKEAGSINVVMSETTDLSLFDVVILELNMDTLLRAQSRDLHAKSLPKFPESVRDIALIIPKETASTDIENALRLSSPLMREISLFDVFEGAEIGAENRSLAYHLTMRADDHTLTEDEISQAMVSAEKSAASLGATVRK
jgi:phenylalanyl-tRNA synthetase beta chain